MQHISNGCKLKKRIFADKTDINKMKKQNIFYRYSINYQLI